MTATEGSGVSVPTPYLLASLATLVLAVVATTVGLFVEGFYRDDPVLLPQLYGQDLLTLAVAVPALAVSLALARRGSLRGYVVWLGVTGYLFYTYASYAFLAAFNELYLVYTTLLALTLFTLVGGLARLDADALRAALGDHPVRAYVAFQGLLAGLVALLWLSEIVPATLAGTVPQSAADAGLQVNDVHSLDLGVVVPAFALSALLLWKRRPIGYAVTAVLLVKATTLGLAVLAMVVFMLRAGQAVPAPQLLVFGGLSLAGLVLTGRFVRAIGSGTDETAATPSTGRTADGRA